MNPIEQALEFLSTLTDLALDQESDDDHFLLEFEYGRLSVVSKGDGVSIQCDFVPALDGVLVSDETFLQTLDAFQAAVLEGVDDVRRLPEGYSYPHDFIYKGSK